VTGALTTHRGGCHCERVAFEVDAPDALEVSSCNCSICGMTGYLHLLVAKSQFRLTAGRDALVSYRFNTGVAEHLFCRVCGIKSFYVPRSHPDGFSVNARCLDPVNIRGMNVQPFDGANWEQHVGELPPLLR
jgi:hypothetical protein